MRFLPEKMQYVVKTMRIDIILDRYFAFNHGICELHTIGGRKGGAMGLQPNRNIFQYTSPT